MDNLVSLNNTKASLLEFDLSIQGMVPEKMTTKFVIQANGMDVAFEAKNVGGSKWEVHLPELPILERTAYPFFINIDADGYNFKPLAGTVNVVGSNDVYVTTPKNPKIAAPKSTVVEAKAEVTPEVKPAPIPKTKPGEKGIAQIAEELMEAEKTKAKPKKTEKVEAKKAPVVEAVAPIVEVAAPVVEAVAPVAVVKEALLPKIELEPKKPVGGDKDDAVRAILEQAGLRAKDKPVSKKKRFSLKN